MVPRLGKSTYVRWIKIISGGRESNNSMHGMCFLFSLLFLSSRARGSQNFVFTREREREREERGRISFFAVSYDSLAKRAPSSSYFALLGPATASLWVVNHSGWLVDKRPPRERWSHRDARNEETSRGGWTAVAGNARENANTRSRD